MVLLKLLFAFLAIWSGLVVGLRAHYKENIHALWFAVFSGSVCGLLWAFGIFD